MTFPQGLLDAFEAATTSIFRLETLQHYAGDPNYSRWQAGEPWRDTESKAQWCDLVRRRTAEGVAMQRVHVVTEPLTEYMRFELEWSYPPNVEAGEDVRVRATPPLYVPDHRSDFWLFDEAALWTMNYDVSGQLLHVENVTRPAAVRTAIRWRAEELNRSVPLVEFMART